MTETITQLPIDECKDWILHALGIIDQYCIIRYAIYNKWEFLIVTSSISFECFPDIREGFCQCITQILISVSVRVVDVLNVRAKL